jgi:hypothetical protein
MELGPTGVLSASDEWSEPLGEVRAEALKAGKMAIYVFGRIDYRDAFGNLWFTEFRHIAGGDAPVPPGGGAMSYAIDGNKAT